MSKQAREFWISDPELHNTDPGIYYIEVYDVKPDPCEDLIHVIEKSAADKLAEALEIYANQQHPIHHGIAFNQEYAKKALASYRGEVE